MRYSVVVHKAEEGGFWVEVPALPGCYSQGESVEETLRNVRESIELYLETLREEGQNAPNDAEIVYQVSVAVSLPFNASGQTQMAGDFRKLGAIRSESIKRPDELQMWLRSSDGVSGEVGKSD